MQLSKVLKTVTLDPYTLPNDFCIRSVNLASRKTTVIIVMVTSHLIVYLI